MGKKYFFNKGDERCHDISHIKEVMKANGFVELDVYEAKMITGLKFFYCTEYDVVGEVGESCGIDCEDYRPRNGKNGRCSKSSNCYEVGDRKRIKLNI